MGADNSVEDYLSDLKRNLPWNKRGRGIRSVSRFCESCGWATGSKTWDCPRCSESRFLLPASPHRPRSSTVPRRRGPEKLFVLRPLEKTRVKRSQSRPLVNDVPPEEKPGTPTTTKSTRPPLILPPPGPASNSRDLLAPPAAGHPVATPQAAHDPLSPGGSFPQLDYCDALLPQGNIPTEEDIDIVLAPQKQNSLPIGRPRSASAPAKPLGRTLSKYSQSERKLSTGTREHKRRRSLFRDKSRDKWSMKELDSEMAEMRKTLRDLEAREELSQSAKGVSRENSERDLDVGSPKKRSGGGTPDNVPNRHSGDRTRDDSDSEDISARERESILKANAHSRKRSLFRDGSIDHWSSTDLQSELSGIKAQMKHMIEYEGAQVPNPHLLSLHSAESREFRASQMSQTSNLTALTAQDSEEDSDSHSRGGHVTNQESDDADGEHSDSSGQSTPQRNPRRRMKKAPPGASSRGSRRGSRDYGPTEPAQAGGLRS